jgi:hypothetical protein
LHVLRGDLHRDVATTLPDTAASELELQTLGLLQMIEGAEIDVLDRIDGRRHS